MLFGGNGGDDVFGLGADTELAAPDAQAGGYVELGVATLMAAPRTFIDIIGDPGDGPNLSTMGVTTKLEVDASSLSTIEVVGLMVEDY